MAVKLVGDIYDLERIEQQQAQVIAYLKETRDAIIATNNARIVSKNADMSSFTTATQQLNKAINDTNVTTGKAIFSNNNYIKSVNQYTSSARTATKADEDLIKARQALNKANSQANVSLQGYNVQKTLANKAAKEEAMINLGLVDTYTKLSKQLAAAQLNAKNLAAEFGVQSIQAKAAAKEAAALDVQVKAIDKSVGLSQRNVGNYGSAFGKAFSGLKSLANLIPGIGISGLFLIGYEAIQKFITGLSLFNSRLSDTKRQTQLLADVNKTMADNAGKEVAQLQTLYAVATNTNLSINKRKEAVDELQEVYPDYFKNVKDEVILQGKAKDAYDSAKTAILEKAKAQAIEGELSKLATKELAIQNKQQDDFNKKNKALEDQRRIDATKATTKDQKEDRGLQQFNVISKITSLNKEINDSNKELAEIEKDRKFLLSKVTEAPTTKKTTTAAKTKANADSLQELKDTVDNEFEIYKIAQEAKIRLLDADIKSDRVHYLDKLVALENFTKASKELLDRQEQEDINNKQRETAREIQHLEEQKSGKSVAEKARINENIKISEQNLQQDILLIQATYADKSLQLVETSGRTRQDILDDQHKKELANYEAFLKEEEDANKRNDDKIKEGFEKREKQEKEFEKKSIELQKELRKLKLQLALDGEEFLFTLATSGFERRLNLIQREKDEIDKRKNAELATNDATIQSEESKAANILIINSRAQAQKEALDKKSREIEYRKAQFEKAQQIFDIGIATIKSIALIKANAAAAATNPLYGPIFGKILAAQTLAQIPWVLASSALSIGAILAKPIAKYKGGRGEGKEEFALVHQGEYIHRDSGLEHVSAVETLTHLMPKDKVYTSKQAMMKELAMSALPLSDYSVNKHGGIDKSDMKAFTNEIVEAVGEIKIHTQMITKDGWRNHNQRLADYDKWVNKYIKN